MNINVIAHSALVTLNIWLLLKTTSFCPEKAFTPTEQTQSILPVPVT